MSDYLEKEGEAIERMEKAGFTEEQIDAIYHYIDFYLTAEDNWRDMKLDETLEILRREVKSHSHLDGKVVVPYDA